MALRAFSALIAVLILFTLGFYVGIWGLVGLCTVIAVVTSIEGSSILFHDSSSLSARWLFVSCTLFIYAVFVFLPEYSEVSFALTSMVFCSVSLFLKRKFSTLTELTSFQARSLMGFVYLGLLPGFAARLFFLEEGIAWFFFLLCVVFFGDTFAYLFGRSIGSRKLMPMVSPKKTLEGSAGGLLGSVLAGVAFSTYVFPQIQPLWLLSLALLAGLFAQLGDLFESLLKRVADIKDSGKIMPGHGGLLDRIDGVLFSAPIVLAGAMILTQLY